jgi:hypothetical protein
VTAEVLIDGAVISRGTATGGYNLAMAEVAEPTDGAVSERRRMTSVGRRRGEGKTAA